MERIKTNDKVTENGYSVIEDAVECALVVASAVDAFVLSASFTVGPLARDAFETNASTKRYAYCARTARRYVARSLTVTDRTWTRLSQSRLIRRFSFRSTRLRQTRPLGRAILLASQVLNI